MGPRYCVIPFSLTIHCPGYILTVKHITAEAGLMSAQREDFYGFHSFENRDIQKVLREIDSEELAISLVGADNETISAIKKEHERKCDPPVRQGHFRRGTCAARKNNRCPRQHYCYYQKAETGGSYTAAAIRLLQIHRKVLSSQSYFFRRSASSERRISLSVPFIHIKDHLKRDR